MANGVPQGVNISGPVVPTFNTDIYPTHIDTWGKGGWRYANDHDARDAIPAERRSIGMVVQTLDDDIKWSLGHDLTTWSALLIYACKTIVLKDIQVGTDVLDLFTTPGIGLSLLTGIKANCRSNIASQDLIVDIKVDNVSIWESHPENLLTIPIGSRSAYNTSFTNNTFTNGIITLDIVQASGTDVTIEMEFSL